LRRSAARYAANDGGSTMGPGSGFETSLVEAAYALLMILLLLVMVAVFAGILTLPIFFGTLAYKVGYFWAADVTSGSRLRRWLAAAYRVGFPAFSIFATVLSFGYFGVFDWPDRVIGGKSVAKIGPTQEVIKNAFDEQTRKFAEGASPALPETVINWRRCPNQARQLIEIWNKEMEPPNNPFDDLFPKDINPPDPPVGTPPVPKAVIAKAAEIIAAEEKGTLYTEAGGKELTKEERVEFRTAEDYFDRAIKESRLNQDKVVRQIRSFTLYILFVLGPIPLAVFMTAWLLGRRGVVLGLRNVIRALLRTSLTYLAVFVLVFVLCCIWSILAFLAQIMTQNDANLKAIITEKYQIPSQMKPSHLGTVKQLIAELPPDQRPDNIEDNIMTWAFVGGTLDPAKRTPQNSIFFFATEPEKVMKMMPGLDELSGEERAQLQIAIDQMIRDKRAVVIGAEKLKQMGKRVGDRMTLTSLNYKEIEFEFNIIAEFPSGSRWEQSAVMNRAYLDDELKTFPGRHGGRQHELADKSMNLIWVRLPNPQAFDTLSTKINDPGKFSPAIKLEIESSAYANFLSPFKTLFWFMKWPLSIGLLAITTLVASLVIGIGVRERKTEIAVLKVLGFRPWMVLGLVLGEALLVGILSGFMSTATAYSMVNARGGLSMGIAFFNKFYIADDALWWGPLIGGVTALIGSVLPSISAYGIKASQVFSRVT
jgi:putative ABC transport system permease protein